MRLSLAVVFVNVENFLLMLLLATAFTQPYSAALGAVGREHVQMLPGWTTDVPRNLVQSTEEEKQQGIQICVARMCNPQRPF
jgi:hypothetical protein